MAESGRERVPKCCYSFGPLKTVRAIFTYFDNIHNKLPCFLVVCHLIQFSITCFTNGLFIKVFTQMRRISEFSFISFIVCGCYCSYLQSATECYIGTFFLSFPCFSSAYILILEFSISNSYYFSTVSQIICP